jgi:hypothetical protein
MLKPVKYGRLRVFENRMLMRLFGRKRMRELETSAKCIIGTT